MATWGFDELQRGVGQACTYSCPEEEFGSALDEAGIVAPRASRRRRDDEQDEQDDGVDSCNGEAEDV